MNQKRVVITGLGTINPLGSDIETYFSNLDKGESGSVLIDRFDTTLFKTRFACQINGYDSTCLGIDRKEANKNDRFSQYALIAASQAIADSAIDLNTVDLCRIGVILGSGVGGVETFTKEVMDYSPQNPPRFSPFLITKFITNIASGQVAIKYGFRGPNYNVTSACASSAHAIIEASDQICLGRADVMIAGGSEAPITIPSIGGFNSIRALSTNNEEYKTASRPFDASRDGFVIGEGSGILVLEELEHALRRGAHIYAEIAGYGLSSDAYHITAPDPTGKGEVDAMTMAIQFAGISPKSVDYINLHGTSTKLGDMIELNAVKEVFSDALYGVSMSSTKSMTGHLLGAAGSIEALACIHAIRDGIIPPTINFREPDPELDTRLDLTLNKACRREVRVAMSNNFGFGGHNACLVFRKFD